MTIFDVAIIPLITAVVELFKGIGLKPKYCPLAAAVLGVIMGILYVSPDNVLEGILVGLSLGLSAVGLYSGGKNTVEWVKNI